MSLHRHPRTATAPPTLSHQLRGTFRTLFIGASLIVAVLAVIAGVLFGFVQPDLRYDTDLIRALRINHEAMHDHELGLRDWISRDHTVAYTDRDDTEAAIEASTDVVVQAIGRYPDVDRLLVDLLLEQRAWLDGWATPVSQLVPNEISEQERRQIVAEGRARFHDYREAHGNAAAFAATERDEALERSQTVLIAGLIATGVVTVGVAIALRRQRRRLDDELAEPLKRLLEAIEGMERHERAKLSELEGPLELQQLGARLEGLDTRLREQRDELESQRAESEAAAVALRGILEVAREISGSLKARYVAETVAEAMARIVPCERVMVWIANDDRLVALHDSSLTHGEVPTAAAVGQGEGLVGLVARHATPRIEEGDAGFPLVVGGRVVGVLEIVGSGVLDQATRQSAETLASHAASALEAARLHRATEEMAQVDALTRLFNRRRLDGDLATEVERATRYGRPLGFILLDLDHFKQLNDNFGHQYGDEVLSIVGECLAAAIRASDTVYRYGGEEFAVLVREGDRSAVLELAERLRVQLTSTFAERGAATAITASFGAALVPEHGVTPAELVLAADRALYRAKAAGRDQVMLAELPGAIPFSGDLVAAGAISIPGPTPSE